MSTLACTSQARSGPTARQAKRVATVCAAGLLATAVASQYLPIEVPPAAVEASVLAWATDRFGILGLVLFQIVAALSIGALLSGASWWYFFVHARDRFNPVYRVDRRAILRSYLWAALGITGGTLLAAPLQLLALGGAAQTYYVVGDYGWGYLLLSVVLLLVFTETLIYWIHRALHHRLLFDRIHMCHHQFREPTPWTAFSFHPVDAFSQALPYHIAAFIFPLNIWVYTLMMSIVMVWSVSIHDRVSVLRFPWLNYAGHHTLHHLHADYNYGQYLTFWDRIAGTYRSPRTLPPGYRGGLDR
jgi:lathosterol oxidase